MAHWNADRTESTGSRVVHAFWILTCLGLGISGLWAIPRPALSPSRAALDTLWGSDTTRTDTLQQFLPFPFFTTGDTTRKDSVTAPGDRGAGKDSLMKGLDSLVTGLGTGKVDSTWVVYLDSTSRLAQFKHYRSDHPAVGIDNPPPYSLYLGVRSPVYKRDMTIDSTGASVTFRETVNGLDVKVPVTLPLQDYLRVRMESERRAVWRSMVRVYTMKEKGDDLAGLFGSLTNIEIPVPANPLLSIFGGKAINLHITGAVDIRGAFRRTSSDRVTLSSFDQVRNEPDFNQDVQINVNGTIGDKLNILADWNTQRTFEYENQLKIKYTGYDDEIVQSVEAGNVSLQTPSLIGGGQALFGIKAKLQTGPLTLTTLLSQKKGQIKELSVSGGAQQRTMVISPHQYSKSYYFLDVLYRDFFERLNESTSPVITPDIQRNRIIEIDVWLSRSGTQYNTLERQVNAYIDLPPRPPGGYPEGIEETLGKTADRYEGARFIRLDPSQYKVNRTAGYIVLNTNVSEDQAIAVAYRTEGPNPSSSDDDAFYGDFVTVDTAEARPLLLKLVKPKYLRPSYKPAWDLLMKNVYPIGGRDLKKEGFELKVYLGAPGRVEEEQMFGEQLLQVLGLDRFDQDNAPRADNAFDFVPGLTVDLERAEIIFPSLRPFDSTIVRYFARKNPNLEIPDSLLYNDVYDTTSTVAANNTVKNIYFMRVSSSTAQSSRFSLGFNIVEGSVAVLLNGTPLTPNVDYTVDYIIGEVVIRNPQALLPGANVQVKYEQNDLFQLASKTLIGARGEMDLFPNTSLGFTIMNLAQATLSDKVRLGEEPTNNMILGIDGRTSFDFPLLTDMIDALPFYRTREISSVRISGEAAYMLPDANTKKSTVASDGGASIAYIDDFEGARRTIPFTIIYSGWHMASQPVYTLFPDRTPPVFASRAKAKLAWYNILPSDVSTKQIWPNRSVRTGQDAVTVLSLDFDPNKRGVYNFSPYLDSTLHRDRSGNPHNDPEERRKNWAGIMRYISSTGGNILEQNIDYLEIWMQSTSEDITDLRRGRLFVDLGRISEDAIPNNKLNSEDIIVNQIPNGVLNPGEDLGLDMLSNEQERIAYADFLNSPTNAGDPDINPADPAGDNWAYSTGGRDYSFINGTEGNQQSEGGRLPDTEDLNNNNGTSEVDQTNTYVEYEIPLDSIAIIDGIESPNPYIVGGGTNKWYQFRVPLREAARVIPPIAGQNEESILQDVQYLRIWLSGFSKPVSIRIAEVTLVGNQWQEIPKSDTTLKVSVVNIEDNPNYSSPPGVIRERDRTQPDQIIEGNEQSLALQINQLRRGDSRQTIKYFIRPLDLFNYRSMKMFVHGDPLFDYFTSAYYDAEIFIRFGADTLNFYEYRQPVRPGWDPLNEVEIVFSDLTSIKASRDSLARLYRVPAENGPPGASYGVQGNPSLTQVKYIGIGITNPSVQGRKTYPLNGEVWVNELRLVEVDNSSGVSYRFDTQIKLADLGSFSFNYSKTDPNFHGLDQRFGSRITGINWAVNTSLALERFLPAAWQGTTIPFGYSHSENLVKPRYLPNTDILVDEAAARAGDRAATDEGRRQATERVVTGSQTLRVQDSYSVSNLRIALPLDVWYIRDTFSKLTYAFNYSTASERNPSIFERMNWLWNFRVNYGINLPADYYIQPFKNLFGGIFFLDEFKDWKFYYVPITNINSGLTASRSRTTETARIATAVPRITRNFTATRAFGFGWKLTEGGLLNLAGDYSLNIDRTLLHLDNDTMTTGFGSVVKHIFFGGKDSRYGQRFAVNSRPKIPNILDITKYFDLTANYSVNYRWQNTFQRNDLGKSTGFDNSISLSTNFRLKALTDPWFKESEQPARDGAPAAPNRTKGQTGDAGKAEPGDTSRIKDGKTQERGKGNDLLGQLKFLAKIFLKVPLLDYENINIQFTQSNRAAHSGVPGTSGFLNFWGRLPFQSSLTEYGPSRLYQLGIITDPSGTLEYAPRSGFPFVGWKTVRGLRAPNGSLSDQFGQNNSIALRTNRPLWEGASLEINWKVGWQFNKTTSISTTDAGVPIPGTMTTTGSIERSFLSLPPVLFFKVFKSNLEDVGKKFEEYKNDRPPDVALAEAFERGLEALPFLNKFVGQFLPRANWSIRWDGVEKIAGINSVVERLSLEHVYTSSFKRDFQGNPDGTERTNNERVTYGFSPLVGLNSTFKELFKGNFSGTFRYTTTTSYDLNLSVQNIVETRSQEMALSLTYSRKGFEFPLFGVSLKNDVDVTLTFSQTKNARRTHDPNTLTSNQEGIPLEGNTRTIMEPRIRYVLSSRVTAALFYRYSKTAPDEGGSLIPGTTTNEAGVDIHISIQ